jgi:DNA polymerase III delta prime subunit
MNGKRDEILWVEKYRPRTVKECILPKALKAKFQGMVDSGELPNMILAGTSGTGKTTIAQAIAAELGADFLKINASEEGNIDTLRVKIRQFASTVSLTGSRKIVCLDEADYMNVNSLQPALRGAVEEFKNTGFILTVNRKNKVLTAIHSRCPVIDFKFPKAERPQIALEFLARLKEILKLEKVPCESDAILVEVIKKFFPDFRRIIGEIAIYAKSNKKIDSGLLAQVSEILIQDLMKALKAKDFVKVRSWVVQNLDNDADRIFRSIYDGLTEYLVPKSIPEAILILADYQYKAAFVADQEINMAAALIQIMVECEFK